MSLTEDSSKVSFSSGIKKLTNFKLDLHIDGTIRPVAQAPRRILFNLRKKVDKEIAQWLASDIIEPVYGPTPWVSPVVVVPKPNGDVRLRVDTSTANKAILRERAPIPTIDEVLQELTSSQHFSKIDLRGIPSD